MTLESSCNDYCCNDCSCNDCSCNLVYICSKTSNCYNSLDNSAVNQKIIQHQARTFGSLYTMNIAALNVRGSSQNNPLPQYAHVNQNQSSDRNRFHIQTAYVATRGNSVRGSITRARPGSLAPGGTGVDIKHNSYDRYLGRLKATNLITENKTSIPLQGNKTKKYGLVNQSFLCKLCE